MDAADWKVIERLQQGIPLCPRPFAAMAEEIGMSEDDLLRRVRAMVGEGSIRRLGPRIRHHQAGVRGNIMVAWRVPDDRVEEVGATLAASPAVTHCYERPPFEGFPYNVYSMVHAADLPAAEAVVRDLAARCRVHEYQMLKTVRELKKSTPVYRRPEGDHAD